MSRMRFEGKVALVTGAAQGIGRAIAEAFLAEGAVIVAVDVRDDGLARLAATAPGRVHPIEADLGDAASCRNVVSRAMAAAGALDVLVNCAGIQPDGPALDVTVEDFDRTFAVNVRAPFILMQEACRRFVEAGRGTVVNITSANAIRNESPESAYNASKAALGSLTAAFAHELGHLGVRVNAVAPGETLTPEAAAAMGDEGRRLVRAYLERVPMRRPGRAEEQAAAVLFLASDEASFITGQTLLVDGGELTGTWYLAEDSPPVPPEAVP